MVKKNLVLLLALLGFILVPVVVKQDASVMGETLFSVR
jgi:hypothetical protein